MTSALRDSILFPSAECGSGEAARFLVGAFESMQKGDLVHPDIVRAVMQAGAAFGQGNTLEWFRQRLRNTESEHDRINVLTALGCFQERDQIRNALAFVLDEVPDRNKFIPLVRAAANPIACPLLWEWFEDHLERLEKLHPIHFERIIGALVPLAGLDREDRVRAFFGEYMSRKETARDVILMALEKLEINRRMRAS
jgi:tricorn protease interacting factor F2/3